MSDRKDNLIREIQKAWEMFLENNEAEIEKWKSEAEKTISEWQVYRDIISNGGNEFTLDVYTNIIANHRELPGGYLCNFLERGSNAFGSAKPGNANYYGVKLNDDGETYYISSENPTASKPEAEKVFENNIKPLFEYLISNSDRLENVENKIEESNYSAKQILKKAQILNNPSEYIHIYADQKIEQLYELFYDSIDKNIKNLVMNREILSYLKNKLKLSSKSDIGEYKYNLLISRFLWEYLGRDENEEASNPKKDLDQSSGGTSDKKSTHPLNQILYGPPGTGKTYHTINRALEIINGSAPSDRKEALKEFNSLKEAGQIDFITFHQSYGYEEFVEGIKPVMDEDDNDNEQVKKNDNELKYKICDGVFKRICKKAEEIIIKFDKKNSSSSYSFKKQLTDEQYNYLINNNFDIAVKNKNNEVLFIENNKKFQSGDELIFSKKNNDLIPEDGFILEINKQNYVLIIDEINRGNISKIFGELITLIEKSKRIGADDELKVTLPYSGDKDFGVPANLYIIGTMNTADRSIALMDIALRRRFQFVEMMPNANLLNNLIVEGINIRTMFETINERIKYLMDRDHQIGHSFFMPLIGMTDKIEKYKKLQEIFYYELIPLLQEYFYEDWEKIQIILGDHPKQKSKEGKDELRFIIDNTMKETEVIGFDHDDIENDKVIYKINSSLKEYKMNEQAFIKIYDKIGIENNKKTTDEQGTDENKTDTEEKNKEGVV